MRTPTTYLLAILTIAPLAVAAEPAGSAQARARAIAPFLDEGTLVVARIDLQAVDIDVLTATVQQWLGAVETDSVARREDAAAIDRVRHEGGLFVQEMRKAGGREMYLVASLADFPTHYLFTVVPLSSGADADRIERLLYHPPTSATPSATRPAEEVTPPINATHTARMHGAVVGGFRESINRLRQVEPADRPEIADAFAAVQDAPIQVLVIPSASTRMVLQAMMPELPPFLGGGATAGFTEGYQWGVAGLGTSPRPFVRMVTTFDSPQAAQAFRKALRDALAAIGRTDTVQRVAPTYEKGLAALDLNVRDNHVTTTLEGSRLEQFVQQTAAPALLLTKRMMNRHAMVGDLGAITNGLNEYYNKHKAWPDDLQVLVRENILQPFHVTSSVPGRPDYIYLKPREPWTVLPEKHVLVYEPYEQWREGIAVGTRGWPPRVIGDQAEFERLLAATRARNAKPAGTQPSGPK